MDRRRTPGRPRRGVGLSPRPIEDEDTFAGLLDELADTSVLALDTEFHREKTFFPELALVQLGWDDRVALVDPLRVDVSPLGEVLAGDVTTVIHAAGQDLEVLEHVCGASPARLFDTQIAAGFLGYSSPSLGNLLDRELGVRLPKADRLTDWLKRPLSDDQLEYAAGDVDHLLELHDRLVEGLVDAGRLGWAEDECRLFLERNRGGRDPEDAWRRVKEARRLEGRDAAIAREVAAWRERRAAEVDRPVRRVLSDLAIVSIARKAPRRPADLEGLRGVDRGVAKGRTGQALLDAVERGRRADPPEPAESNEPLAKELRPAATLIATWLSQQARDLDLDPALLATRADVEALLQGNGSRLARGWRTEMIGDAIPALLEGRAAVAFEDGGRLRLEERSGRPLGG
ncbi:MAG: HRDC domain-containing protein [Actinomycetota bacterium]